MFRALALTACLSCLGHLAHAGAPPKDVPPDLNPQNKVSEQQRCQMKCSEPMAACMQGCAGQGDPEADDKARAKMMSCVTKCSKSQAPCMKACEKKQK